MRTWRSDFFQIDMKITNGKKYAYLVGGGIFIFLLSGLFFFAADDEADHPEVSRRNYFQRCVCENLLFRESYGGALPPNIAKVEDIPGKQIYRSGHLTPEFIPALTRMGIRTIITLNSAGMQDETHQAIIDEGIRHIEFDYYAAEMTVEKVQNAIRAILYSPSPLLVHCYSGADRTGIVIASLRARENATDADMLFDEMRRYCHITFEKYSYFHDLLDAFIQEAEHGDE